MRRGRRNQLPPALVILILLALAAAWLWQRGRSASGPPAAGDIRIATWNLRKFSDRARPDLVTIVKIIREGNFDVLAVQEVQREGQTVEKLRRELGEPWRHIVSNPAGDGERFAFLYRGDKLELAGNPALISSQDAPIFARVPYAATFKAGQFDFTLVTVHLSWTDTDRRRREAEALARFARDLAAHAADKDVIVLGDFNEQAGHGNLHFFEANGWVLLNRDYSNVKSSEIYDNILIDRRCTKEWTGKAGVIRFDEALYGNDDKRATDDVSDHRPAWADFSTTGPDDD